MADRAGGAGLFPDSFDPIYFSNATWRERVTRWGTEHKGDGFAAGNMGMVRQVLSDRDTGLRMVVNITAHALLSFLTEGRYRNLYASPVIGGVPQKPNGARLAVDHMLKLENDVIFGAVALGGTGVRFYGEYCMVIDLERIRADAADGQSHAVSAAKATTTTLTSARPGAADHPDRLDPRLFDRDSFDVLVEPLAGVLSNDDRLACLRGRWDSDVVDMAMLRVLPQVGHDRALVTSGTVSEAVLKDQEFIEVHLRGTFGPEHVDEIRASPDDVAMELSIDERERRGRATSTVEREWVCRRREVARRLDEADVTTRIVTLHGRGYQWR